MSEKAIALREIETARRYSLKLLEGVDDRLWFRQPAEGVTHIAWQVGHLAAAQYMLCVTRLRGELPEDQELFGPGVRDLFIRGSVPAADPAKYPSPGELREILDRVHALARATAMAQSDAELAATAIGKPHSLFDTKMGALFWCARHEMLHAGQIGLLKRLLGIPAAW